MDFGEQIKIIRQDKDLTQEQMAQKLYVSRQAVSNWENNKNLPDIQMLIDIASAFDISLDQLILGGNDMNNMTEKLIKDTSEGKRAKFNIISACLGAAMLVIGAALIAIKAASVEYVDAQGVLHENFFLLPIAFLFMFGGFVTFTVTAVRNFTLTVRNKNRDGNTNGLFYFFIGLGVVLVCVGGFFLLLKANSGRGSIAAGLITGGCGVVIIIAGIIYAICRKAEKKCIDR